MFTGSTGDILKRMERMHRKRPSIYLASAVASAALTGCSIWVDSYLTNPADVHCDGQRTKVDLEGDGVATFVVHGAEHGDGDGKDVATVKVRRSGDEVSVMTSGDTSGPPQQVEADGFTAPTPLVEGAELSTFGAGGAWVIDVRPDSVVIQGTCDGM